eukprot:SAG31_NODE_61_length_29286_cov_444.645973_12_plen_69_part_00
MEEELCSLVLLLPNSTHPNTPVGDVEATVVRTTWNTNRDGSTPMSPIPEPQDHFEIGSRLGPLYRICQ